MNTNPCRNCGEKWFTGHRCKQPRLKCFEVDEDDEQGEVEEEMCEENKAEVMQTEEQELVTLSLESMAGLTAERSMKMKGRIGSKEVTILIDSGATSNFISEKLAHERKLHVT